MSLKTELYGMPRSVSKLESRSERVESPKRRNPNRPVITYTTAQRATVARTIAGIVGVSLSSLCMV